jgi:hypothetical protein
MLRLIIDLSSYQGLSQFFAPIVDPLPGDAAMVCLAEVSIDAQSLHLKVGVTWNTKSPKAK